MSEIPPGVHWHSDLWASIDGQRFGDAQRMALLVAIAESGSITAASQSLQISYKAAWDAVAARTRRQGHLWCCAAPVGAMAVAAS
jgi:molybdenum-dependent DNA-binding transcriptional regulator ModE